MKPIHRTVGALVCSALVTLGIGGCSRSEVAQPEVTPEPATSSESLAASATESAETTAQITASASATTSKRPAPDCTKAALKRSFDETSVIEWVFVEECEGDFAYVGAARSDVLFLAEWNGSEWESVPGDGVLTDGLQRECYNESTIRRLGVGPRVKGHLDDCATGKRFGSERASASKTSSGYSYSRNQNRDGYFVHVGLGEAGMDASFPACDGRYILIVDSIIDEGSESDTFHRLAVSAMQASTPDREFTVPGQCSSLRKKVDGNVIYPVYLDFGSDESAMCAAKSRYGGNGRTLNDSADFTDPCG